MFKASQLSQFPLELCEAFSRTCLTAVSCGWRPGAGRAAAYPAAEQPDVRAASSCLWAVDSTRGRQF